jgi:hypothetical protein
MQEQEIRVASRRILFVNRLHILNNSVRESRLNRAGKGGQVMPRMGESIRRICQAVEQGQLAEPFSPAMVNAVLGITYAGVFLPKHRVGNPGFNGKPNSELFIQVSRHPALYRCHRSSENVFF